MEPFGGFVGMLIAFAVAILIFFVCRSLILWYWKLDKIEEHLAAIRTSLEEKKEGPSKKSKQSVMKNDDSGIGI